MDDDENYDRSRGEEMKKIMITVLALAFILAAASVVHAQAVYVGAQVGYTTQKPKLPDFQNIRFDDTLFYGARVGLKVAMFAVEASYLRSDHNIIQAVDGLIDWRGSDLEYQFIGVNVKFFPLSLAVLHPYLTAGYGYFIADVRDIDKDSGGSYNAGVGLELKFGKISILAEGKYRKGKAVIDEIDLDLGKYSLSAGINFYF